MTEAVLSRQKTPRPGRFLFASIVCVAGLCALAASWLAPNHYPPWPSFHNEAAAFAAVVLLVAARLAGPGALLPSRIWLVAAALSGVLALQWCFGQIAYGGDAFVSGLYVAGAALAWWLGTNNDHRFAHGEPVDWFAWVVVASAGLSAVIALLQWLRMEEVLGIFAVDQAPDLRPAANIAQPNHLATLLMMATVLAVLLRARGRIGGLSCAVLVALFGAGLILTESRSGLLSAVCLAAIACTRGRDVTGVPSTRAVLLWLAMLLVLALAWSSINEALLLRASRASLAPRDPGRLVIWKQCLLGIAAAPWLGYGWRQSMVGQKVGAISVNGWLPSDYAHNIVLDLMLWVGVPLALLLTGAAAWWLLRAFRRARRSKEMLLFGSTIPILVHSFFEFPFSYSYFLFPAMWALGLVARLSEATVESPPASASAPARDHWRVALAMVLFGTAAMAVGHEYLQAEEDNRVMRFEMRRVGRTPADYERPKLAILSQFREVLDLGRVTPHPGMPADEISRLREASRRFNWATLHLRYAISLALNGDPVLAQQEMHLLHAIYGDQAYEQSLQIWRGMQEQYPQLAQLPLP